MMAFFTQAALCFAAAVPEEHPGSPRGEVALLIPSVVILLLLAVSSWVVIANASQRKRLYQHMERIEAKTDRMIELLESIADELRRQPDSPNPLTPDPTAIRATVPHDPPKG